MGWYYTHDATRQDIIRELTKGSDNEERSYKTLAHAACGYTQLYAVHEITDKKTGKVERFIGVYLLQADRSGWGYKPMSESMHPYCFGCPLKYLDMVPEACPEWRKGVREYWEKRNAKAKAKRDAKKCGYCRNRPATTYSPDGHKACELCREEQLRARRERQAHLDRYERLIRAAAPLPNREDWIHTYGKQAIEEIEARVFASK